MKFWDIRWVKWISRTIARTFAIKTSVFEYLKRSNKDVAHLNVKINRMRGSFELIYWIVLISKEKQPIVGSRWADFQTTRFKANT